MTEFLIHLPDEDAVVDGIMYDEIELGLGLMMCIN